MFMKTFNGYSVPTIRTFCRKYHILSIETSCDDTCVSIIDRSDRQLAPKVVCHLKSTLNSAPFGGIVPTKAHEHHQIALAGLVKDALERVSPQNIDIVCATRGPGMPGSLSIGLNFGKALSVAWNKPFIGVHHMLGHLLIPRMESNGTKPSYPFITLLVSGGHTILVLTTAVDKHEILCDTIDIAIGDSLDKTARELGIKGNMMAKEMEAFIKEDMIRLENEYLCSMKLPSPLRNQNGRLNMEAFSFSPFLTAVRQHLRKPIDEYTVDERRSMAFQVQEKTFDHLIEKINLVLRLNSKKLADVKYFVCSGGVGANMRLRQRLQEELIKPFESFHYPKLELCTDNAVMIGWAAIELYEEMGLTTPLDVTPIRKWPLNEILSLNGCIDDKNL